MVANQEFREAFRAEIVWLLTGLNFRAGHGRFLGGRLAAVEFVPVAQPTGGNCLGFRILTPGIRSGVPESTLAEARRQLEARLATPVDEWERAARDLLEQLSHPRILSEDLRGWHISLRATVGGLDRNFEATTDKLGCASFAGILPGAECLVMTAQWGVGAVTLSSDSFGHLSVVSAQETGKSMEGKQLETPVMCNRGFAVTTGSAVVRDGASFPSAVLRVVDDFGFLTADLVNPPSRLWGAEQAPPAVVPSQDLRRLRALATPTRLLNDLPEGDNWMAQTRRSLARLNALFLVCEDPQRRLDSRPVNTLAHQVSLVRHILDSPQLSRVLIADEVGLGKTIEAGLIIQELLAQNPSLRLLYLAPARLVHNVRSELDRLGIAARQWTSADSDARLDDPRIIASIHRAVHRNHFDRIISTAASDILVVDECSCHLSDWAEGGGDPRQKYRLVEQLIARQRPTGRVLFLSGTPHQGHAARFENLLRLLRRSDETDEALRGRVIYRTKEDVRDWEGRPLFPGRNVNPPILVDLGREHQNWLEHILRYFAPTSESAEGEARRRAAGWRCAQALQWAASSPQAGLGYLVRQAIRAGWSLAEVALQEAIAALRPYRSGTADQPVEAVYDRLVKEVERQQSDADVEDIEDSVEIEPGAALDPVLAALLREGLAIVRKAADSKWEMLRQHVLEPAGAEKVVLFAQPIETVMALAGYLRRVMAQEPALILGGQSDAEREQQVQAFRNPRGARYLVSLASWWRGY